jgi:hypothetical protein
MSTRYRLRYLMRRWWVLPESGGPALGYSRDLTTLMNRLHPAMPRASLPPGAIGTWVYPNADATDATDTEDGLRRLRDGIG